MSCYELHYRSTAILATNDSAVAMKSANGDGIGPWSPLHLTLTLTARFLFLVAEDEDVRIFYMVRSRSLAFIFRCGFRAPGSSRPWLPTIGRQGGAGDLLAGWIDPDWRGIGRGSFVGF